MTGVSVVTLVCVVCVVTFGRLVMMASVLIARVHEVWLVTPTRSHDISVVSM
jgi:hypothetical protein